MSREIVRFVVNVPAQVALKFATGKPVEGQYGPQVMYSLADDRVMYLDGVPDAMLRSLAPAVGEPFTIVQKWTGRKGEPRTWDVYRHIHRLQDDRSPLEEKLEASLAHVAGRKAATSAPAASSVSASGAGPARGTGTYGPAAVPAREGVKQIPQKRQFADAFALFLVDAGRATRAAEIALAGEGGSVRFDSRDLAAIATSMFIAADKAGYLSWDGGAQ